MKTGAGWPWAIGAVLGVTVVANVVLLWQANEPGAASIEPDYYRRALAWDSTQAAMSRSAALGWSASAAFAAGTGSVLPLTVTLSDAHGASLAGLRASVVAVHNLDPDHPLVWPLAEATPGRYAARVRVPHAGRWELRVVATRGSARFMTVLHADAPEPGRP